MSAVGSGDDLVGIGGPDEGRWLLIVIDDEAADGGLEIDNAFEHSTLKKRLVRMEKNPSTALSQLAEVASIH